MGAVEDYIEHQTSSAILFRTAHEATITLTARIEELESELYVWKNAMAQASKTLKETSGGDPIVAVILDGDGCIFDRRFLVKGREGGREAGIALSHQVNELTDQLLGRTAQIVVTIFLNVAGLSRVMTELGVASQQFDAFILGFSASHPLFNMVDVGIQKEAADAKIRETVRLFTGIHSCKLILAGVGHDGGYSSLMQSLETQGLARNIHVLKGYKDMAFELERLNLKTVEFRGIFEPKKLVVNFNSNTPKLAYATAPIVNGSDANHGQYASAAKAKDNGNIWTTKPFKEFKQVVPAPSSKPEPPKYGSSKPEDMYCSPCKATIQPHDYQAHMKGQRHRDTLAAQSGASKSTLIKRSGSAVGVEHRSRDVEAQYGTGLECIPCGKRCSTQHDLNLHFKGRDHQIKVNGSFKPSPLISMPPEICPQCDIECSALDYPAHLRGQRHRDKLLSLGLPSTSKLAISGYSEARCDLCDATMQGKDLEAHYLGQRHNDTLFILDVAASATTLREIDENKSLSDQQPPPCTSFYVERSCPRGQKCSFAHNYVLTREHMKMLRTDVRSFPCARAMNADLCACVGEACSSHRRGMHNKPMQSSSNPIDSLDDDDDFYI